MAEWIFPYWTIEKWADPGAGEIYSKKWVWTDLIILNPSRHRAVVDLVVYERGSPDFLGSSSFYFSYNRCGGGSWILPAHSWFFYDFQFELGWSPNSSELYDSRYGWFRLYSNEQVIPCAFIRRFWRHHMALGSDDNLRWVENYQETVLPSDDKHNTFLDGLINVFFDTFDLFRGPRSRIYARGKRPVPVDQSKMRDWDLHWINPFEERSP